MKNIRIVFMGTPIFAAKILENLIANKVNIVGVVTQPDKKIGRKQEIKHTEVKEVALKNNIEVYQPIKVRGDYTFLELAKPDLIITAAYGQIVPDEVLNYPKLGCVNVHGSLLPKYRGGAPIHYAILNGDKETGVTIMEMVSKMDAGDIISQQAFEIKETDNLEIVHNNMIDVANNLLIKTLPNLISGDYNKIKQDPDLVTFSPTIKREEEMINWEDSTLNIYNKIRAFNPWPVAYTTKDNKRIKLFNSTYEIKGENKEVGKVISVTEQGIKVSTKDGFVYIVEFQLEGKKRTNIKDFLNGNNFFFEGDKLK